jgi:hypothetical protein
MKLVYLLVDGRERIPYAQKWRIFSDKDKCLEEARKLGYDPGWFSPLASLGEPGMAMMHMCGETNVTLIPVLVED